MKKLFSIFLSAILISACGTVQNETYPEPLTRFYGETWEFHGFQETGNDVEITRRPDTNEIYTIVFKSDGSFVGKADCNSYFGKYAVEDEQLALLGIGSTKVFCGERSSSADFFRALENTRTFELYRSGAVTPDKYRLVLHHLGDQALVFLKDTL